MPGDCLPEDAPVVMGPLPSTAVHQDPPSTALSSLVLPSGIQPRLGHRWLFVMATQARWLNRGDGSLPHPARYGGKTTTRFFTYQCKDGEVASRDLIDRYKQGSILWAGGGIRRWKRLPFAVEQFGWELVPLTFGATVRPLFFVTSSLWIRVADTTLEIFCCDWSLKQGLQGRDKYWTLLSLKHVHGTNRKQICYEWHGIKFYRPKAVFCLQKVRPHRLLFSVLLEIIFSGLWNLSAKRFTFCTRVFFFFCAWVVPAGNHENTESLVHFVFRNVNSVWIDFRHTQDEISHDKKSRHTYTMIFGSPSWACQFHLTVCLGTFLEGEKTLNDAVWGWFPQIAFWNFPDYRRCFVLSSETKKKKEEEKHLQHTYWLLRHISHDERKSINCPFCSW